MDAIERIAQPIEKEIMRLSQVHRINTERGSKYFFYRQRGFSDLAAKYLIYSDMGIIAPHPSRVTPTGRDNVTGVQPSLEEMSTEKILKAKAQNYEDGYRNGRADKMIGGKSDIALAGTPGLPGYSEGYRDGYNGQPNNNPFKMAYSVAEGYADSLPIEKQVGGVFYDNYKVAWEVGRLDRISGEVSQSIDVILSKPGGADGYRDGKEGKPLKHPMVYFATKLREGKALISEEVTKSEKNDIMREVERLVEKELKGKASRKIMNEIIKEALSNLYKTLWLRRATWLSGI